MKASRKRKVLSWYLDIIFFLTLWGLIVHFFSPDNKIPIWIPTIIFLIIKIVIQKYFFPFGIGNLILSINSDDEVDTTIHYRETWITMLIGVVLINSGLKSMVRWTQIYVETPFMGGIPDYLFQIFINLIFGILTVTAGYMFFKMIKSGIWLGIILNIIEIISSLMSWELWDEVVVKMVMERRKFQGLSVREGEIEFMQKLIPEGTILFAFILIILMLFSLKRFYLQPEAASSF